MNARRVGTEVGIFVVVMALILALVWSLTGCTSDETARILASTEVGYGQGVGTIDSSRASEWGADTESTSVWVTVRPLAAFEPPTEVRVIEEPRWYTYPPAPPEQGPAPPEQAEPEKSSDVGWDIAAVLETALLGTGGLIMATAGALLGRKKYRAHKAKKAKAAEDSAAF